MLARMRPVADGNQQQRLKLPENSQVEKDETDTDHQDTTDTDRPVLVSLCFDHPIESGGLKKIYCQLRKRGEGMVSADLRGVDDDGGGLKAADDPVFFDDLIRRYIQVDDFAGQTGPQDDDGAVVLFQGGDLVAAVYQGARLDLDTNDLGVCRRDDLQHLFHDQSC